MLLISAGTVDGTDPTLRERVASLRNTRDRSTEALDYAKKSGAVPIEIDPVVIERFTRLMRERRVSGDAAARKAYLSAIIDSVVVSEHTIRITGSNDNLRSTLGPNGQPTPWFVNLFRNGAQGRDRTTDTAIFSRMLYQLSYLGRSRRERRERRFIVRPGSPVHHASPVASRGPSHARAAREACPA